MSNNVLEVYSRLYKVIMCCMSQLEPKSVILKNMFNKVSKFGSKYDFFVVSDVTYVEAHGEVP